MNHTSCEGSGNKPPYVLFLERCLLRGYVLIGVFVVPDNAYGALQDVRCLETVNREESSEKNTLNVYLFNGVKALWRGLRPLLLSPQLHRGGGRTARETHPLRHPVLSADVVNQANSCLRLRAIPPGGRHSRAHLLQGFHSSPNALAATTAEDCNRICIMLEDGSSK